MRGPYPILYHTIITNRYCVTEQNTLHNTNSNPTAAYTRKPHSISCTTQNPHN